MAKPKLEGRRNTSVNLTDNQIAWMKANGYEISALLRDLIDAFMENAMSSEELLIKKRKELLEQQKALESELAVIDTQLSKREEKKTIVEKVIQSETELEISRKEYVLGCQKSMRSSTVVNYLWINHIKEAYKFKDSNEAKAYVLKTWVEAGATESSVRKYLRMDE